MVALAILAAAGLATVGVLRQALDNEWRLGERERCFDRADRVLAAMALLDDTDLDRRLGERRVGEFLVTVQRPEVTLYRISVRESASAAELVVTVVYRPGGPAS